MYTLTDWCSANKWTLNVEKMIHILFQQTGSCKDLEINIDTFTIKSSKETKFLGMWLDRHLTWSTHMQKLTTKQKRNLNLMKNGNKLMTSECKRLVYYAHIQSHLPYGILLWGNSLTNLQIGKLTKIQENCLEYIDPNSSFKDIKILKLEPLIELENAKFGYKLIHGLLPTHKNIPNVPIRMNKQYRASFLNKGSQALLTVKSQIKEKPTLKSFSCAIKEHLISMY